MKKFLILILFSTHLFGQTEKSMYDATTYGENNTYYKDVYNDLDNFVGTWKFAGEDEELTVQIQKRLRQVSHLGMNIFYQDVLVGGYKYVLSQVNLIDTLILLQDNSLDASEFPMYGNVILGPNNIRCIDCSASTRRIYLQFSEPNRDVWELNAVMILERIDSEGLEKIKIIFKPTDMAIPSSSDGRDSQYDGYTIPFGTYTLTKQ